ncbi:putative receptor-like protein kinase [Sesamum alatum]|uniref:Receptor-like protein kinase n=1 Tax=Sesamum alatum TaxID=300844 RepID=A0AAE1XRQ0_9LAMI|nr:putative receptor-like protein kinase [Sesamum alatum]
MKSTRHKSLCGPREIKVHVVIACLSVPAALGPSIHPFSFPLPSLILHQRTSMENFHSLQIFSCFLLLSLLSLHSCAYTLPDHYFINCGSASSLTVYGLRTFTGDVNSEKIALSSGGNSPVEDPSSSTAELYRSARIFRKPSSYELDIAQDGTYVVRFHFFPFPALGNLPDARFNVEASGFRVLSNFSIRSNFTFPLIEEIFLTIPPGKFKIKFVPHEENSFAFVNAMEVFLTPPEFIPDSAVLATRGVDNYNGLLSSPLRLIHRINVGGPNIMPNNDTLLRFWIPDDDYLFNKNAAKKSETYNGKINYQSPGAREVDAPPSVYNTAKEMNIIGNSTQPHMFNISWRFDVKKGAKHLVRVHFCDIISRTTNEFMVFDLFIDSKFNRKIYPYGAVSRPAAPFYNDFVVDSDNSGFLNVSVGPRSDSRNPTAFLNGVEIMELITDSGSSPGGSDSTKRRLLIIVGSAVGGLILVLVLLIGVLCGLKKRKWKPVDAIDWPLAHLYGGSTNSRTTDKTVTSSPAADFNLGLKVPFSEILYATKNFDKKLRIGEGGFGKVYKGTMRNGTKVAVKRSEPGHGQGLPEFQTEIMVLSKIRHQHLVSLIGYCDERDEMILVYEFMEKGTLRDHLYVLEGECRESTSRSTLSWDQRLKICIGAAKVLCARPAIDNLLPRDQCNLAEWGLSWHRKGQLEKILDPFLVGKINPNSLRKFGETVEKCLQEYGADRPNMGDVMWDLEYSLQLQHTAVPREPHEDSTTDVSWNFQMNILQRLPSHSIQIGEDELHHDSTHNFSGVNASEVFSQLRLDEAR